MRIEHHTATSVGELVRNWKSLDTLKHAVENSSNKNNEFARVATSRLSSHGIEIGVDAGKSPLLEPDAVTQLYLETTDETTPPAATKDNLYQSKVIKFKTTGELPELEELRS